MSSACEPRAGWKLCPGKMRGRNRSGLLPWAKRCCSGRSPPGVRRKLKPEASWERRGSRCLKKLPKSWECANSCDFFSEIIVYTNESAMKWIALRMLTGDWNKYLGLIFGVSFATLLMSQQVSVIQSEERTCVNGPLSLVIGESCTSLQPN